MTLVWTFVSVTNRSETSQCILLTVAVYIDKFL